MPGMRPTERPGPFYQRCRKKENPVKAFAMGSSLEQHPSCPVLALCGFRRQAPCRTAARRSPGRPGPLREEALAELGCSGACAVVFRARFLEGQTSQTARERKVQPSPETEPLAPAPARPCSLPAGERAQRAAMLRPGKPVPVLSWQAKPLAAPRLTAGLQDTQLGPAKPDPLEGQEKGVTGKRRNMVGKEKGTREG